MLEAIKRAIITSQNSTLIINITIINNITQTHTKEDMEVLVPYFFKHQGTMVRIIPIQECKTMDITTISMTMDKTIKEVLLGIGLISRRKKTLQKTLQ